LRDHGGRQRPRSELLQRPFNQAYFSIQAGLVLADEIQRLEMSGRQVAVLFSETT
jgi:hypothetical protein